ncbi:phospholipase D family protein [Rhodococcus sp. NPDC003383]
MIATTFTLEPDFFERNCLARFLAVESVDEDTGSVDDLVARLELEEGLRATTVTVLADRHAQAERSSLRWDVLHCHVDSGLLHSKVAVLLWERATRVVVGSANLTDAGYRRNIEMALAANLGPECLFPANVLQDIANELQSYLELVPGLTDEVPARLRAVELLDEFRRRISAQSSVSSSVAVAFAPTNTETRPLDALGSVWNGSRPLGATHVSAYWDSTSPTALTTVRALLTGRPASARHHDVAVVLGPTGETTFPPQFLAEQYVDSVVQLGPLDQEIRRLHAKCLVLYSNTRIAVMVGSSNHTEAGLGLKGPRRHREVNVWLGAPTTSKEGKALSGLVPRGKELAVDLPFIAPDDEDEDVADAAALPAFFGTCRLSTDKGNWKLTVSFTSEPVSDDWTIRMPSGAVVLDYGTWSATGRPNQFDFPVKEDQIPVFVDVHWAGNTSTWAVLVDDRHSLPPGFGLRDLLSSHLFAALSSGRAVTQIVRELQEQAAEPGGPKTVVDPLRRFDSLSTLMRRGRALGAALAAFERRLARPVVTSEMLAARLSRPLGPRFLARKIVEDAAAGKLSKAEALFTLSEVALSVSRVPWSAVCVRIDAAEGRRLVRQVFDELDEVRARVPAVEGEIAEYSFSALKEARKCLNF